MTTVAATEPHATSKHTLCGYGWSDVCHALIGAISVADNARALRWSAELVCSELGLGRLEATLYHAWALHVGPGFPAWCRTWYITIQQLRTVWTKTGGDIKAVRNMPQVRQLVAEAVSALVLASKKPLPALPTSADCFRESEVIRGRLRTGGGSGDQLATRRVWSAGYDGIDLKTIGNEFEAALRANQVTRMLFWIVWVFTLDSQTDIPSVKERGPAHLTVKQRKSLVWYLIAILREIANDGAYLSVEERNAMFGLLELSWNKLGVRGRRDVVCGIAIAIQDNLVRRTTLTLSTPSIPSTIAVRNAIVSIDAIYSGIAVEARRFIVETPRMVGLTADAVAAATRSADTTRITATDKLALAYKLL